jgi:hypothetical protein
VVFESRGLREGRYHRRWGHRAILAQMVLCPWCRAKQEAGAALEGRRLRAQLGVDFDSRLRKTRLAGGIFKQIAF